MRFRFICFLSMVYFCFSTAFVAADEAAVEAYRDFTPTELLALSEEELQSSVPMMFTGAAQLATSPFGEIAIQMSLNALMYEGLADLDSAIRAFQQDLGEDVTGEMTVGQIHELGYRAARTRLTFVSFFPFDFGGYLSDTYAQVTGTATILGDRIAYPVNHVTVECQRQNMTCRYRQIALQLPDENSWTQSYSVNEIVDERYRVTRWEDEQIDALPFNATGCRINQLSFNFRTEEFFEIARNNTEGDCEVMDGLVTLPALEQPRITQIVEGWDIISAVFDEINQEVLTYYSSAFRERLEEAAAEAETETEAGQSMDEAALDAATGVAENAPSLTDFLTLEGFDLDTAIEAINGSELSEVTRRAASAVLEGVRDNPNLLPAALEQARNILGLE